MHRYENALQKIRWTVNRIYRGFRLYYSNRSLKAWVNLLFHAGQRLFTGNGPDLITIGLSYDCPCNCVHCSSNVPHRKKSNELDTRQVIAIIDQARKLGIVRVTFFGGEPLMRHDIVELVRYAHRAGMITRINTNGWFLNHELVSKLKRAGLTQCDVSIDHPHGETHDRLRGLPGLHQKAIEGITILKEHKIICQIVTYASKENVTAGLENIIRLGKKLRVDGTSIVFPIATGCWHSEYDVLLSEDEKDKVRKLGNTTFVHVELPYSRSTCNVSRKKSLYVSPEGDVTPCPFIPYSIGNLKDYNLEEIWSHFTDWFDLPQKGDCLMNNISDREIMKTRIQIKPGSLQHSDIQKFPMETTDQKNALQQETQSTH